MQHDHHHDHHEGAAVEFPRDTAGLPAATATETLDLADGEAIELRIAPVANRLGEDTVRMLAYNGSIPGPTLRVREGSHLLVDVVNDGDLDATVHWHGLRLENRYDGTHETQPPIPVGGRFTYRLDFPDAGVYWYHPHIRQDYGQELGLYGNIVVVPAEAEYWPPVHRELALTLDDVLLEDGKIAAFHQHETTYSAMGRYGNVLLVAGQTEPTLHAQPGEVVRLYLTNTANSRVFDVALTGARMKLVGGDSGRYEREELVESVVLAPSERAVVDVLFGAPGRLELKSREHLLASVEVGGELGEPLAAEFSELRTNPEWATERERLAEYVERAPDKTLAFVAELDLGDPGEAGPYACPMHPEVVSDQPGSCPKCGMKLLPVSLVTQSGGHEHHGHGHDHAHHEHGGHQHHDHGAHHDHGSTEGGIEWEDDMAEVNRMTTSANTRWSIVDRDTGKAGHEIDWRFRVGDRVKVRLLNELESDHPMHHPFHVHGAGRFLVLARNGAAEPNLVWKDTVLVRTGEVVDVLLDITNPGVWMAHCHIAEHHESGMMFSFVVAAADAD